MEDATKPPLQITQPASHDAFQFTEKRPGSMEMATPSHPNTTKFPRWAALIMLAIMAGILVVSGINLLINVITQPHAPQKAKDGQKAITQFTPENQATHLRTYTNDTYHFSFTYPQDWTLQVEPVTLSTTFLVSLTSPSKSYITIAIMDNPQNLSIEAYNKKFITEEAIKNVRYSPTTVGGISGLITEDLPGRIPRVEAYIKKDKQLFNFSFYNESGDPEQQKIFNDLLSSFQFSLNASSNTGAFCSGVFPCAEGYQCKLEDPNVPNSGRCVKR